MKYRLDGRLELFQNLSRLPPSLFRSLRSDFERRIQNLQSSMAGRLGRLGSSFQSDIKGTDLDSLSAELYTSVPYAPAHEFGATITPKTGNFLKIPLQNTIPSPSSRAFWSTTKSGNLIRLSRQGDILIPLFVLVRSVTLKPRLGFFQAASQIFNQEFSSLPEI